MIRTTPLLLLLGCAMARADDDIVLQKILVEGSRASLLGLTDSASAGAIGQKELAARPVYRPGELLEAIPGLVASQHSGEGKANQFYLRGFNLDHGTDLKTTLDDMPVNQRSHAHGQGWTDLNFLIPELVGRLDYRKGPYSARDGDFASAGSTAISYSNRLARGQASVSVGPNGYARTLLADSPELGQGSLLYALELLRKDGPFTLPDGYRKLNAVLRYSQGYANNGFSLTAMAYRAHWNATDQIPQRAVDDGSIGRFDAIDPTDGGAAQRYSLSALWRQSGKDSASKVAAYLIRNQLALYSNFSYFLNDPVRGDQFAQPDRRVTSGFEASHTWHQHESVRRSDITLGLQVQNDNIFNGLLATQARQTVAVKRLDHVVEASASAYLEASTRWSEVLRTSAGLRADNYGFDRLLSPSFSLALGPWARTELYFNAGSGFHSNDARGADARLARSRGIEAGLRSELAPTLQTALALYRLDFASELAYVGDAGTTAAQGPSRRLGVEASLYYKPAKWLALDADLAFARARYRDALPFENHIRGAVEGVAVFAASLEQRGPWSGALRLRVFGPRPLLEDNRVRSHTSATLNARLAYKIDAATRIELEAFNLANRRDPAIEYYYASQLKGEKAPVQDIHFHPIEARSLRLALTRHF